MTCLDTGDLRDAVPTLLVRLLTRFLLCGIVATAAGIQPIGFAQIAGQVPTSQPRLNWKMLEPLPEKLGVAGAFAGISNGRLLVAGGANFPGRPPWEGGSKVWHDHIWAMDLASGKWTEAGRLPRPLGYGVSISTERGLCCLGGSDQEKHHQECFLLHVTAAGLQVESLPDFPQPLANGAGALVDQSIYVCGGTETPDAKRPTAALWRLDLSAPKPTWERLEDCPGGPRLLPVAASDLNTFYLFGGADLITAAGGKTERRYRRDAWAYTVADGWRQLADIPTPVVAAPSPAPILSGGEILILGGDTGEHVGFQPPEKHPGFSRQQLAYDPGRNQWRRLAEELPVSRVTVPLVKLKSGWLLISGEQRPAVRSPEVWQIEEHH